MGLEGYCSTAPFDPSVMVHFRKRLGEGALRECNELIVKHGCKSIKELIAASEDLQSGKESQDLIERCDLFSQFDECNASDSSLGTLILNASCAPADIAYPTDLRLLACCDHCAAACRKACFCCSVTRRKWKSSTRPHSQSFEVGRASSKAPGGSGWDWTGALGCTSTQVSLVGCCWDCSFMPRMGVENSVFRTCHGRRRGGLSRGNSCCVGFLRRSS
jgi:hypothetical protein